LEQLECDPTEIEEFVEQFAFLDTISSKISRLEKEYSTVSQLYSVVKYYEVDISEEQNALYKILSIKFSQLKTSLKLSTTTRDAAIAKFRNNLESCITRLRVDVSNLKAKVSVEFLFVVFFLTKNLIIVSCKTMHIDICLL
jgi:hypothetical protein